MKSSENNKRTNAILASVLPYLYLLFSIAFSGAFHDFIPLLNTSNKTHGNFQTRKFLSEDYGILYLGRVIIVQQTGHIAEEDM